MQAWHCQVKTLSIDIYNLIIYTWDDVFMMSWLRDTSQSCYGALNLIVCTLSSLFTIQN